MAEDTIPRPIRYKFLEQAQRVCDLAKVDYWEQAEVLSSLREQMEAGYRAYDQAGLYKDDAEAKTLEDFGNVEDVARVHRDGWRGLWHRLLFSQRYTVHRLVGPVVYGMFHCFLRTSGSLQIVSDGYNFVLYGWNYYFGIIIIAVTLIMRRLTGFNQQLKRVGELIAAAATLFIFAQIAQEWIVSIRLWALKIGVVNNVPHWINLTFGLIYFAGYVAEVLAFVVVFALAMAEIFEVPACYQAVIEAKRRGGTKNVGGWAALVTNAFQKVMV